MENSCFNLGYLAFGCGPGHIVVMEPPKKSGPVVHKVPDGDNRPRLTCLDCGYIAYDNPKVIVGAVCVWEDRYLMCRRAIQPRQGFWTIPAGFLENNETTAAGAAREVQEEANAEIVITGLIGIYEIPRISQIYVVHKAEMTSPDFAAGPESEAVELLTWDDIPWNDLAFTSVSWALNQYRDSSQPVITQHPDSESVNQ